MPDLQILVSYTEEESRKTLDSERSSVSLDSFHSQKREVSVSFSSWRSCGESEEMDEKPHMGMEQGGGTGLGVEGGRT